MLRLLVLPMLFLAALCGVVTAQTSTLATPSPTPKPPPRRPGLDQFGLSGGVFSGNGSTRTSAPVIESEPVTLEYVDANTFDVISASIEKSAFMEAELRRVLIAEPDVDMSAGSPFSQYFLHNMIGLAQVSSMRRDSGFGGNGVKSGQIITLLRENEVVVMGMSLSLGTDSGQYARKRDQINSFLENYGIPLLSSPRHGTLLDRPALVRVMMARINRNFALVKRIMTVRK